MKRWRFETTTLSHIAIWNNSSKWFKQTYNATDLYTMLCAVRDMNTKTLNTGETVHDFRPNKLRWGWNGLSWKVADDRKTAEMIGIGKGLMVGDFIALNHGAQDCGYKIETIEYDTNPKDMFKATVTGVYEFDKEDLD